MDASSQAGSRLGAKLAMPSHAGTTDREIVPGRASSFVLNSFADPHPLNPDGSILYKNGGWEGVASRLAFRSVPTFQIRRTIPSAIRLAPRKTSFVILELEREPSN